jgi:fucose 4-O-acetylase-like acetyltransferase
MPAAAPVPAEPAIDRWSAGRSVCLDNLKVLLIAAVIVVHAVLGYVATPSDAWWPYANVQETQIGPFLTVVLFAVAGPFALFMMALLFLISGLLTPASVARKGPKRFARDRFVKLGLPFLAFTLLLWPVALYALYRPFGHVTKSYAAEFADSFPDTGPLWFVGVLLVFSLGYAGWVALPGRGGTQRGRRAGKPARCAPG